MARSRDSTSDSRAAIENGNCSLEKSAKTCAGKTMLVHAIERRSRPVTYLRSSRRRRKEHEHRAVRGIRIRRIRRDNGRNYPFKLYSRCIRLYNDIPYRSSADSQISK